MREIPADPVLDGLADLFPAEGAPTFVARAAEEMGLGAVDPTVAEVEYVRYWPRKGAVVLWSFARPGRRRLLVSGRLFGAGSAARMVERSSFRERARDARARGEADRSPYRLLPDRDLLLLAYPMDGRLSGLPAADSERWVREVLAPAVGMATGEVHRIERRPVSFKPWRRCVFHYRLHSNGHAPGFFAKVFRDDRGGAFLERARAVRRELRRVGARWETPRARAYLAEEKVLVFDELSGAVELSDLLHRARREASAEERLLQALGQAGEAVGELRRLDVSGLSPVTPETILEDTARRARGIAKVEPELGRAVEEAVTILARAARGLEHEPLVPSHAAFRHDQIVLHGDRVAVLDLDGLCLAGRGADGGYLLGMLDVVATRRPRQRELAARCARAFLAGLDRSGDTSAEWLAWYRAAARVKKTVRSFLSLDRKWPQAAAALGDGVVRDTLRDGGIAA